MSKHVYPLVMFGLACVAFVTLAPLPNDGGIGTAQHGRVCPAPAPEVYP